MSYPALEPSKLPFVLHLLVELPACLVLFVAPDAQLAVPQPLARPLIRQYAVLLFCVNLMAALLASRPLDGASCGIAGAMALYHLAPIVRATGRLVAGQTHASATQSRVRTTVAGLGGPMLHLVAHSMCLGLLAGLWVGHVTSA